MNTTDNRRAEARSRANARLRTMTIGTALLGVAATGTLGWVAAMTYDGSSDATAAVAQTTTTATTVAPTASASPSISTSTVSSPTVTTSTSAAHATTGGS